MSKPGKPELYFNRYFSDALSGRFTANCDPLRGLHDLGELGLACFGASNGDKNKFVYTPPWAQNYRAELVCIPKEHRGDSKLQAMTLNLHGPERGLSLTDNLFNGLIIVSSGMKNIPARTDIDIDRLSADKSRELVISAARAFFDTPPPRVDLTTVDKSI